MSATVLPLPSSVVFVGEGVAQGGAHAPERHFEIPIAERGSVAFAVGLALGGKRPIVELTSSQRLSTALEALEEAAAIAAHGEFAVPMVVCVPLGDEAGPRIDRPMIASMAAVPGLQVLVARDAAAAAGLLRAAVEGSAPTVLFTPRTSGRIREAAPAPLRAEVLREGEHATAVAFGAGVAAALAAADALAAHGVHLEVIDLVSAAPIDTASIGERLQRTGRLIVADGGDVRFAHELTTVAHTEAFEFLEAPPAVARDTAGIVAAVHAALQF